MRKRVRRQLRGLKRGQLVEVVWTDACSCGDTWVSKRRNVKTLAVVSIGYVRDNRRKTLVMVGDYTKYTYGRMHAVPKICIKSVRVIRRSD